MGALRENMSGVLIDDEYVLSLQELCDALNAQPEFVITLVEYEVIEPEGERESWRFNALCLRRARLARNLQQDLHVNLSGINLALDLMAEIERLESELARLR
jgi:chaperone modulatory protein CbpM